MHPIQRFLKSLISDKMNVSLSFSALSRRSPNSVTNMKKDHRKCHNLSPLHELETPDPTWRIWIFSGYFQSKFLYGPACLRDSRVVIYPCERNKCFIRCPCSLCSGLFHPESGHSLQDRYDVHEQYHTAPHLKCVFCTQMLSLIPGYYCRKIISVSGGSFPSPTRKVLTKAYVFQHSYTYETSKKSLSCEECGQTFKRNCNRVRHFKNVHYKQKHECLKCGKLFGRADNLKSHMKVHVRKGVGKASIADNTDSEMDLSDESIETDQSDESIDTDLSDESIETDSKEAPRPRVVNKAHTSNSESSKWGLSSKSFNVNEDSDMEEASNDNEDAKVCENNFENSPSDSDNSITNIIKCDTCDKEFSSKFNLSRHERNMKYPCKECQERVCSKKALTAHMKAKHGKRDLQCPTCETEFSTKQNLNRHVQNLSANPCGQCSANFCNAHALKGHVYSEHTCKKCPICGVEYEYLNLHIESVHDNTSKTK